VDGGFRYINCLTVFGGTRCLPHGINFLSIIIFVFFSLIKSVPHVKNKSDFTVFF
jgi:hypothetical protein